MPVLPRPSRPQRQVCDYHTDRQIIFVAAEVMRRICGTNDPSASLRWRLRSKVVAREGSAPSTAGCRPAVILFHHRADRFVPLLLGYASGRNIPGRSLPPAHCLRAAEGRSIYFALGDEKNGGAKLLLCPNSLAAARLQFCETSWQKRQRENAEGRGPRRIMRVEPLHYFSICHSSL